MCEDDKLEDNKKKKVAASLCFTATDKKKYEDEKPHKKWMIYVWKTGRERGTERGTQKKKIAFSPAKKKSRNTQIAVCTTPQRGETIEKK